MPQWYRKTPDGWLLTLHIQPGAKNSEVVGLLGEALKVREAALGVEHSLAIESRWLLGDVYLNQGKYDEAKSLLEHALDCARECHPGQGNR